LSQYPADTFSRKKIPENHNWTADLELESCQRKTGAIYTVEILSRIHEFSIVRPVISHRVFTKENLFLARRTVEHEAINIIHIVIAA